MTNQFLLVLTGTFNAFHESSKGMPAAVRGILVAFHSTGYLNYRVFNTAGFQCRIKTTLCEILQIEMLTFLIAKKGTGIFAFCNSVYYRKYFW